jgi:hypothetical protein
LRRRRAGGFLSIIAESAMQAVWQFLEDAGAVAIGGNGAGATINAASPETPAG